MAKNKNWILIVVGVVILVVILGIAAVVGFGYFAFRQMDFTSRTGGNVEQDFSAIEAQFAGQVPYVELKDPEHGEGTVHRELEQSERTPLKQLRIVVYDPREKRFVKFAIPFWLLRLGGNKPINLRSGGSGFDAGVRLSITTEDLERRGKGLVLNTEGRHGEHVIVWAE